MQKIAETAQLKSAAKEVHRTQHDQDMPAVQQRARKAREEERLLADLTDPRLDAAAAPNQEPSYKPTPLPKTTPQPDRADELLTADQGAALTAYQLATGAGIATRRSRLSTGGRL